MVKKVMKPANCTHKYSVAYLSSVFHTNCTAWLHIRHLIDPSHALFPIHQEFMKAIKWTKKIMYEEGHALPQLIHMWHMIVRHPALFYKCRSHFVGQMVNSLSRLGLPPKYVVGVALS